MKLFKNMKFIQLGLSIIFDVTFFLILLLHKELRNTVFTNSSLTILCACMWGLCIVTLVFLIFDVHKILEIEVSNHELNREMYLDNLTGIPNRYSLDMFFHSIADEEHLKKMGCCVVKLDDLTEINEDYGRDKGNQVILEFSNIFETVGDRYGFIGRNGGNEYLALLENCDHTKMDTFLQELKDSIDMYNRDTHNILIRFSHAYVLNEDAGATLMEELIGMTCRKLANTQ